MEEYNDLIIYTVTRNFKTDTYKALVSANEIVLIESFFGCGGELSLKSFIKEEHRLKLITPLGDVILFAGLSPAVYKIKTILGRKVDSSLADSLRIEVPYPKIYIEYLGGNITTYSSMDALKKGNGFNISN
jgi:hypothetical protein